MEKTDPVFQLIDNYCKSYNKENRKKIYSSWYYIPAFSAIAAVMYWKVGINGFMCSMVAGWGLLLTVASIMNRRMSLTKLRMNYSDFKKGGPVTGVISDDFIALLADSGSIDNYAKRRLAEKQQEECGVLRWSDLFEVREEVLKLKERDKRLIGKGAEKLQRYNQQDK
ncbi:hypothetical protein IAG89_003614 [Salmonella enterica]|jgi:hypothetical protein|uniref:Uncharacterized protein n=2 Tax=Enterobacteriaceae TaxID=543 RepID=A0A6L6I793_ECOLX|nr:MULTISPECIES: hypothetical protein [Enterobacteriaceae]EAB6212899.1 hypothetical protein [Salmonella enterica subsp. enterica serovar Agbeni]EBB1884577.1 hypothetical protein [Salmonella enterica]EBV2850685.1 hypothetical protein [Salmonella enterica subsp. enterica serovar Typhimurium]EBX3567298.1 hypothetical protein [Salmonella enterica subsp. enterica serovar Java]ECC8688136.1 hypothetical protein [Salmonella enterica subsp. enterica]EGH6989182.1 hypothetical protein [Salmonella enteri